MKFITLTQPWATLVAIGAKKIETRSWRTNYRGPLAIHAAKGFPEDCIGLCRTSPFREALVAAGFETAGALPRSCVVAVCNLVDVREITDRGIRSPEGIWHLPRTPERDFGDYSPDRYAFYLENVRKLDEPIVSRGSLSIYDNPQIADLIEQQLNPTGRK